MGSPPDVRVRWEIGVVKKRAVRGEIRVVAIDILSFEEAVFFYVDGNY